MFADFDPPPPDVVPGSGLTREDVLRANDATGTWVTMTTPGKVFLDVDGCPNGVGEPEITTGYFAGIAITQAQADSFGLSQEQIPNVHIL